MSLQKTEAVVLKIQKLGETSKIVVLFSKKYGIIKVVAKGARGPKSRFLGALDPLNHINVVFYHKENRDLHLLSQADILEPFNHLKHDLEKMALSMVACEMVMRSQMERDPHPNLFHLLVALLRKLDHTDVHLENVFYWYQLRFLKWNGFKPTLHKCVSCGKIDAAYEKVHFSIAQGGWMCGNCKSLSGVAVIVSGKTIRYLQQVENCSLEDIQNVGSDAATLKEGGMVINKFMAYHIEALANLKSVNFLEEIQRG